MASEERRHFPGRREADLLGYRVEQLEQLVRIFAPAAAQIEKFADAVDTLERTMHRDSDRIAAEIREMRNDRDDTLVACETKVDKLDTKMDKRFATVEARFDVQDERDHQRAKDIRNIAVAVMLALFSAIVTLKASGVI